MEDTKIYNSFVKELTEWAKNGTLPESGNQDIAYYLELQQNRLKEISVWSIVSRIELGKKETQDLWSAGRQRIKNIHSGWWRTIIPERSDVIKEINACLRKRRTLFFSR